MEKHTIKDVHSILTQYVLSHSPKIYTGPCDANTSAADLFKELQRNGILIYTPQEFTEDDITLVNCDFAPEVFLDYVGVLNLIWRSNSAGLKESLSNLAINNGLKE
jgi:hypothetical protein